MTGSANPTQAPGDGGFLAPRPEGQPVDHCFRCGVATPPGVGLCDEHNKGHLSGPSSTQMHATIFGGIVLGVIGFFLLASLAVARTGPYASDVGTTGAGPDGSVTLSFTVTNEGDAPGVADCRVTRDGVPRPDDQTFRTGTVLAGETVTLKRVLLAPSEDAVGYDTEAITVICS